MKCNCNPMFLSGEFPSPCSFDDCVHSNVSAQEKSPPDFAAELAAMNAPPTLKKLIEDTIVLELGIDEEYNEAFFAIASLVKLVSKHKDLQKQALEMNITPPDQDNF